MMHRIGTVLEKHRNTFLILLMAAAMLVGRAGVDQPQAQTVDIPVMAVSTPALSDMESYRRQRDKDASADMAVLESLAASADADEATRGTASAHLNELIARRQTQTALEGALLNSSLYPCVAVVTDGCVTIVTEKASITPQDTALVIELAAVHAGAEPENVRIITTD